MRAPHRAIPGGVVVVISEKAATTKKEHGSYGVRSDCVLQSSLVSGLFLRLSGLFAFFQNTRRIGR